MLVPVLRALRLSFGAALHLSRHRATRSIRVFAMAALGAESL